MKRKSKKHKSGDDNCWLEIENELANDVVYNKGKKIIEIITSGGSPNLKDDNGDTALMWAIVARNVPLVKMLVERGAGINAKTSSGTSVFGLAARLGFHEICEYLISKKVKNENDQVIEYIRNLIDIKL